MAAAWGNMPGGPSVHRGNVTYGYETQRDMREDSEGIQLGRMGQATADRNRDAQVGQANADRLAATSRADQDRATSLQLGMAPINFKRDVFNQVSPLLSGLLTGGVERVGGASAAAPGITRGPVWTDQMVTEQVNAGQAANQAAGDTQNRAAETRMAGQGFGTRSPLLAALQGATNMQTASANADVARETKWDAAQGNADQTYRTDQLALQSWNQQEQQDIARRQMQNTYSQSLASVLAALV